MARLVKHLLLTLKVLSLCCASAQGSTLFPFLTFSSGHKRRLRSAEAASISDLYYVQYQVSFPFCSLALSSLFPPGTREEWDPQKRGFVCFRRVHCSGLSYPALVCHLWKDPKWNKWHFVPTLNIMIHNNHTWILLKWMWSCALTVWLKVEFLGVL